MSEFKRSRDPASNRQIVRLPIAILAAFIVCIGPLFVCYFIIIFKFHGELPPEIGAKIPKVIVFIIKRCCFIRGEPSIPASALLLVKTTEQVSNI